MSTPTAASTRRTDIFVTALAPASWGMTYLVTTELLPDGRPLLAGALRALPAGLALAFVGRALPHGAWWWRAAVLGVLNIGAFFALLFVAAYRLPGGVAATLGSVQPLIAAGLAAVLLGERLRRNVVVAGMLGVAGVTLLVLRANAHLDALGVLAGFAATTSMATGVVLTKRWGRPVPLPAFTSWQLLAGGLLLMPLSLAVEGAPPALSASNIAGFAWLASGGGAIAYMLWFRGVARVPVGQVSLLGIMSPLVATFAGWLALDQTLTPAQFVGVLLALSAMWLGQRQPRRTPVPTPDRPSSEPAPVQTGSAPRWSHSTRSGDAIALTSAAYLATSSASRSSRHWPLVPEAKNRAGSCQSGAPTGTTVAAWPRIDSNDAARTSSLHRSSAMSIPSR
ncbi:MAG TPA: EamA family transporter [Ilumatobacteraceae bacterium]